MSLVNKTGAKKLRNRVVNELDTRAVEISGALYEHFNKLHEIDFWGDYGIEELLVKQATLELDSIGKRVQTPAELVRFNPSGASKCKRELFYRGIRAKKDDFTMYPFQRRWTRNATAVHGAVQRDLLYAEKLLKNPLFKVKRLENGLPAWEKNLQTYKVFKHKGVEFVLIGMMDGILTYERDGSEIGFEFKTKSTTIGTVGYYKMKDAQESHKLQCVAYSLLFGMDEFILMYESVAKDGWLKGADAKPDFRTFYLKVTEEDRVALLDKFAEVTKSVQANGAPERAVDKCLFCQYKSTCNEIEEVI